MIEVDLITAPAVDVAIEEKVIVIELTQAGQKGDKGDDGITPEPGPLVYEQFLLDTYWNSVKHSVVDYGLIPLVDVEGAFYNLPDGWTIQNGNILRLPAGTYAFTWYWDANGYTGDTWDMYVNMGPLPGTEGSYQYPTAPKSKPGTLWGSASGVAKLDEGANISFSANNSSGSPKDLTYVINVVKLPDTAPRGEPGPQGDPGEATEEVEELIQAAMDAISTHIIDPTPHPEYDDMIDLTVLFNNGIV